MAAAGQLSVITWRLVGVMNLVGLKPAPHGEGHKNLSPWGTQITVLLPMVLAVSAERPRKEWASGVLSRIEVVLQGQGHGRLAG